MVRGWRFERRGVGRDVGYLTAGLCSRLVGSRAALPYVGRLNEKYLGCNRRNALEATGSQASSTGRRRSGMVRRETFLLGPVAAWFSG